MIRELREMQIEPVVSVWPTIDERSENYGPMADQGYLITSDRGLCVNMTWMGTTTFYDATHPGAQNMFGNAVRRIITIKAFAAFGWMRLSRNMGRMILIFTATTKVLLYSAATSILSCTPKVL